MELIRLENLYKTYHLGEVDVPVLRGVTPTIHQGELVALMGASGSGKTTLMNILGCLDRPSSGEFWLDGQEMSRLDAEPAGAGAHREARVRLPEFQPAAADHGAAQRHDAVGLFAAPSAVERSPPNGRGSAGSRGAGRTDAITSRRRCRADSSSAWRLPDRW